MKSADTSENIRIFRYEELTKDQNSFIRDLFQYLEIDITGDMFNELMDKKRFDKINKGRQKGQEDIYNHNRKGISGDWKNHFDNDLENYFLERTGNLLDYLGYK